MAKFRRTWAAPTSWHGALLRASVGVAREVLRNSGQPLFTTRPANSPTPKRSTCWAASWSLPDARVLVVWVVDLKPLTWLLLLLPWVVNRYSRATWPQGLRTRSAVAVLVGRPQNWLLRLANGRSGSCRLVRVAGGDSLHPGEVLGRQAGSLVGA